MSEPIESNAQRTFIVAAVMGALAVAIGAFGAHSLKPHLLEIGRFDTFETAVRYHFYHTFALLAVGLLQLARPNKWMTWAGNSFFAGILLFSGSLYAICLLSAPSFMGMVTPLGGLLFIAGWLLLALGVSKPGSNK
jgi:uncharacterized membrane protein YgdD (TMEM256/DUF423 family)